MKYSIIIEPMTAEEGGGYFAVVPDLPGCMSDGETPEEALENVQDAIACWIEAAGTVPEATALASRLTPPKAEWLAAIKAHLLAGLDDLRADLQSARARLGPPPRTP